MKIRERTVLTPTLHSTHTKRRKPDKIKWNLPREMQCWSGIDQQLQSILNDRIAWPKILPSLPTASNDTFSWRTRTHVDTVHPAQHCTVLPCSALHHSAPISFLYTVYNTWCMVCVRFAVCCSRLILSRSSSPETHRQPSPCASEWTPRLSWGGYRLYRAGPVGEFRLNWEVIKVYCAENVDENMDIVFPSSSLSSHPFILTPPLPSPSSSPLPPLSFLTPNSPPIPSLHLPSNALSPGTLGPS